MTRDKKLSQFSLFRESKEMFFIKEKKGVNRIPKYDPLEWELAKDFFEEDIGTFIKCSFIRSEGNQFIPYWVLLEIVGLKRTGVKSWEIKCFSKIKKRTYHIEFKKGVVLLKKKRRFSGTDIYKRNKSKLEIKNPEENGDLITLCQKFVELKANLEKQSSSASSVRSQMEASENEILEIMLESNVASISVGGKILSPYARKLVKFNPDISVSVKDLIKVVKATGIDSLVTFHWRNLRSYISSLKDDEEVPPELERLIQVSRIPKLSCRTETKTPMKGDVRVKKIPQLTTFSLSNQKGNENG